MASASLEPASRGPVRDGWQRWRIVMWGGAATLLALPLVAMQFTREVAWDGSDFLAMGCLLAAACGVVEFGMRRSRDLRYRAAACVAVLAGLLLVWANLAVGVIGDGANAANLAIFGVPLVALVGACVARFRAHGMAITLAATAATQAVFLPLALRAEDDAAIVPIGVFVALWLVSAALFWSAARARQGRA